MAEQSCCYLNVILIVVGFHQATILLWYMWIISVGDSEVMTAMATMACFKHSEYQIYLIAFLVAIKGVWQSCWTSDLRVCGSMHPVLAIVLLP